MLSSIGQIISLAFKIWDPLQLSSLVWLLDPYHPLLRILRARTPGTYHHSLVVGSLAEAAALRIGADARLARIGALYHDIGKTRAPEFFGENGLPSPHPDLDPLDSARMIIRHVADGLTLARRYHLPPAVRDLIEQHHGTSLVGYFYHKAVTSGQIVSQNSFRYPGPRPQTVEAGILMLADVVEAAVRSAQPLGPGQMAAITAQLIEARWVEGELSESGLQKTDLREIRLAFQGMLQGAYHMRVAYELPANGSVVAELPTTPSV